jgi:hypothetical protein
MSSISRSPRMTQARTNRGNDEHAALDLSADRDLGGDLAVDDRSLIE